MKTPANTPSKKTRRSRGPAKAIDLARQYAMTLERTEGEFVGTIKELRGVIVRGKTADECEQKALEAAAIAIETMLESGLQPPVPERERRAQLNLRLTADELERVKLATRSRGFGSVSEFGRAAILAAAHGL